jgi:hypothetical protein
MVLLLQVVLLRRGPCLLVQLQLVMLVTLVCSIHNGARKE